jgi:hypothetical protein
MKRLLRSDAPASIQLIFMAFGLAATLALALIIPTAVHPTIARLLMTYALVLGGFLAVPKAVTVRSSSLALEFTIAAVILASGAVLLLMVRTPSGADVTGPVGSLLVTIALAVLAIALQRSVPRFTFGVLLLLAIKGVATIVSATATAARITLPDAAQYALLLNAIWISGSVAAAWHGRHLANGRSDFIAQHAQRTL